MEQDKIIMNDLSISVFNVVDHLDNEEVIKEYIIATLEDGDAAEVVAAVKEVAKAMGGKP